MYGLRFYQFRIYNSHECVHSIPTNSCTVVLEKNIFKPPSRAKVFVGVHSFQYL